uniref:Portal protein n=1 Tax=viral metagenome TaxID=1070528 RepID=A0A6H1ZR77_9ZZZZ
MDEQERSDQLRIIEEDTTSLLTTWKTRDERLRQDKEVINLVQETQTTADIKWMSNEPKVFFDTSRALISSYPPRFRLPLTINYEAEEKGKMNKAERLLIGIYRGLERRSADTGGSGWLWDLAYWVLLGWYSVFNIVTKTENGIEFIADIWEPMTVYPSWDGKGLSKCVRCYEVDNKVAVAMAKGFQEKGLEFDFTEPSGVETKSRVVNYWRRTYNKNKPIVENAITIAGQLVKPMTIQKRLTRIPIRIGAVGSPDRTASEWETRKGESIIASNRDMYAYNNSMFSLMATILAATAFPNIIEKTRTGQEAHKGEEFKGYGTKLTYKIEDTIELLKHAATPQEANTLLTMVGQQIQKGSVPNSVYGSIPFEISGFALSQLLAAIKYKLGPYLNAMQNILSNMMTDFLFQYKAGKFGSITLSTENPHDLKRGMTYIEEFNTDDVPESIYVDVTIPITSQYDKTQTILNARQALQPPQLMSRETLWETEFDIQDTEQEYERIRLDQVMEDPFVRQIEIIEAMWRRVDVYRAEGKNLQADALKRYIMGLEMQLGIRQGVIQQPGQPGIPPNQMPPEMTMSPNPDQLRSMRNIPPPGVNRRAQTPQERAASKGGLIMGGA